MVAGLSRIAALFSTFLVVSTTVYGAGYVWPIVGSRLVSSTFSEYREGHYHAGIDIRTFGRTGFPIIAVADGYVKRMKISPYGYGKALYLKLDDGNTAVYAHLFDFSRECDSLSYYWRLEHRSSYCDLRLKNTPFSYSAGDTIGYTGRSGTSAPHLHFELRDQAERPFNPLLDSYRVPDTQRPVIAELVVYPMDIESRVDGYPLERRYYFSAKGDRFFVLGDTLQLDGCFGFGATIWDEQGYGDYYLAPLEVRLRIDGRDVYIKRNESFSYEHADDVELEFRGAPNLSRRNTELLFKRGRVARQDRIGDGRIGLVDCFRCPGEALRLEKGLHRGEIIAGDANGNTSIAKFYFYIHRYPEVKEAFLLKDADEVVIRTVDPDGGEVENSILLVNGMDSSVTRVELRRTGRYYRGKFERPSGKSCLKLLVRDDEGAVLEYFIGTSAVSGRRLYCEATPVLDSGRLALRVVFDRGVEDLPVIRRLSGGSEDTATVCRLGEGEVVGLFDTQDIESGTNIFEVEARGLDGSGVKERFAITILKMQSGDRRSIMLGGERRVGIETSSLRDELIVLEREVPGEDFTGKGLKRTAPVFELKFERDRLLRPISINVDFGKKSALYRWDEHKGWKFIGAPFLEGGKVNIYSPGIYGFFEDELPPLPKGIFIERMRGGSGFFRNPWIYCALEDEGSGIDPYSTYVEINGRWTVSEWDEFRKRLYIPLPADFPSGPVRIRVDASDRVGNRALGEYNFLLK